MVPAVRSTDTSSRVPRKWVRHKPKPAGWQCDTGAGVFSIAPCRSDDGCWELWIGEQCLGTYEALHAAADAVERHATGDIAWDDLERREGLRGMPVIWSVGPVPEA